MCGEKVDIQLAKGPGHKSKSSRRGDGRPVVRDSRRSGGDEDGERGGSRERNDNRENRGRDRGSRVRLISLISNFRFIILVLGWTTVEVAISTQTRIQSAT